MPENGRAEGSASEDHETWEEHGNTCVLALTAAPRVPCDRRAIVRMAANLQVWVAILVVVPRIVDGAR